MTPAQTISTRTKTRSHSVPSVFTWLLAILTFGAFLTDTSFIPGVRRHIGPFEVVGLLLFLLMVGYFLKSQRQVRIHPITWLIGLILLVAALSTLKLPPSSHVYGFINLSVLIFMLIFMVSVYNVSLLREEYTVYLLRFFAYSAIIVAFWIITDGVASGGRIGASGPMRNRAHAGIYMLTSFWVILLLISWPKTPRIERWLLYSVLPVIFYCVAVSGRRSVYVASVIGFSGLVASVIVAPGRGRFKVLGTLVMSLAALGVLYYEVSDYWKPASFFKARVGMVSTRLQAASPLTDDPEHEDSFSQLQYRGILRAFGENPILGIGWGGFFKSEYSLTGHEVHSTPLRFLAETGLLGFMAYLGFVAMLLFRSFNLWLVNRKTIYQLPSLIFFIAFCSATLSAVYNRQVTERTFWLLLALYMSFETMLLRKSNGRTLTPSRR